MPHLKNPGGRIVAVDDLKQYNSLLQQVGFAALTSEEEQAYIKSRYQMVDAMRPEIEEINQSEKGIYMATVSQGGTDGYGVASKNIFEELKNLGANISFYQKSQKIGFLFHSPQSLIRLDNDCKIIYTMFESDRIPDEWHEYLEVADKILVPSHWCMEVFAKAGFNAEVVPLGYNHKLFTFQERENKRDNRKDFVFLHYNAYNIRKGFLEVLKAFLKAFDPSEPVKMVFKTTLNELPSLSIPPSAYPNIEIKKGPMSDQQLLDLCYSSDAFVFPSRGEGFGMTPLEAMATGLPTIVPNAHGISEYFNSDYMYEVKVKETCPAIYSRYKGVNVGNMVICDVDDLARQMRYIYEHETEAKEKGRRAAKYVKNWTFEKTAENLKGIFDDYLDKNIPQKPLSNILNLEEVS